MAKSYAERYRVLIKKEPTEKKNISEKRYIKNTCDTFIGPLIHDWK